MCDRRGGPRIADGLYGMSGPQPRVLKPSEERTDQIAVEDALGNLRLVQPVQVVR